MKKQGVHGKVGINSRPSNSTANPYGTKGAHPKGSADTVLIVRVTDWTCVLFRPGARPFQTGRASFPGRVCNCEMDDTSVCVGREGGEEGRGWGGKEGRGEGEGEGEGKVSHDFCHVVNVESSHFNAHRACVLFE